jgi:hypothetical protein
MSIQSIINSSEDGSINYELFESYVEDLLAEGFREVFPPFTEVEVGNQIKYTRNVTKNNRTKVMFRTGGWIVLDEPSYFIFKSHANGARGLVGWSLQKNEIIRLFIRAKVSNKNKRL